MMTEKEIVTRCEYYFNKIGRDFTWNVKINGRLTKTWGRCCYTPRLLEFSKKMLENCTDSFIDGVIAHECAHALVFLETLKAHHHDSYFKEMCARIGTTNDTRCTAGEYKEGVDKDKLYKYVVWCEDCGQTWHYNRKGNVIKDIKYCKCPTCKTFNLKYKQNW